MQLLVFIGGFVVGALAQWYLTRHKEAVGQRKLAEAVCYMDQLAQANIDARDQINELRKDTIGGKSSSRRSSIRESLYDVQYGK